MESWLFISILVVLFSVWLWLYFFKASPPQHQVSRSPKTPSRNTDNFQGVTIHQCSTACKNVKEFHDERFLASHAPTLPVLGCTSKNCTCTYLHHDDRRRGDDRRVPSITMEGVFSANEHRAIGGKDRRKHVFA